jgi:uncharacterized protein involved in tolerance to divalent cations
MIETAFDNKEEAERVIDELLEKKLVVSCQVVDGNSKWRWKNELENSQEYFEYGEPYRSKEA